MFRFSLAVAIAVVLPAGALAADRWIEVKSANVTVVASTGAGMARTLAWQIEQVRSAIKTVWPWAKVNLERPLIVVAVNNEADMRALLPRYWENRNSVHPSSLLFTTPDYHLLVIRADIQAEGQVNINPHAPAYFAYASLVLDQSLDVDLPAWLHRGLAEVVSNTIVRDSAVVVGAPIPDNLRFIAERSRLLVPQLVQMKSNAPELSTGDGLNRFDAQSWALVHMLMFGNNGSRSAAVNQYFKLLAGGTNPEQAFREALGDPAALERDYTLYLNRSIYSFIQLNVDVTVKKEGFTQRDVPAGEAAAWRALVYAGTNRPVEARAAIAQARKEGAAAETHVAEGLMLEREGKSDEARAAYEQAAAAGSKSPYAHYRLATMRWNPNPSTEALKEIEQLLTKAVSLNTRHADAYDLLAEVRSLLGDPNAPALAIRAVQLEPADPDHRLTVVRILLRQKRPDEARKVLQEAMAFPMSPEQVQRAKQLQSALER
jgi:tetratricopeptide (TPR) repeat protein